MVTHIDELNYTDREIEQWGEGRSVVAIDRLGIFYLALLLAGVMAVLFLPDLLALLVTA